jgi:anti-sigma factor RsiW
MEHDHIVERLSEYRDGALNVDERKAVSLHLTECSDCSTLLSEWERLSKAFLRRPPAPTLFQTEAFVARVTARLPGAEPASLAWLTGRWLVPALGLSFGVLAFSFRPYAGQEISDPAAALLISGTDRGTSPAVYQPESSGVDALGLGGEDR